MAVRTAAESGRGSAIRDALNAAGALPSAQQGRPFTLGICRTFTIETQLDALLLGLATLPCRPTLNVGDLEGIEQQLLDGRSSVLSGLPDAVLVLWRIEELHPRLTFEHGAMTAEERKQATADVIERIQNLCEKYALFGTAPVFLSTLPDPTAASAAAKDVYSDHAPRRAILEINQSLLGLASRHPLIRIFDFSRWAASIGSVAFDLKMDLYARQAISTGALISFSAAVANCVRPLLHPPAKVLALDLDNVLWGGVVGEDGWEGLKIGHDFPGNVYRRIQQHVLSLKHRGTLLVLVSKNNPVDVEDAFSRLPDMPLQLSDFAATRVNWLEKCDNLRDIARELNLGLDSFVFVDDQAFEREHVRFSAPEARVLSAGDDPLRTLQALVGCHFFDADHVSEEDRRRVGDYAAQAQRRELGERSHDLHDFLQTLQLRAQVSRVVEATLPRVIQMLAKTNQFNLTTRRHSEADVRRMLANPANVLLTLSLSDKFADQGIVGLAIALGDPEAGTATVDSFLLSCRAIGRGAENALWSSLVSELSQLGYLSLRAEYRRTAKNEQVADLFEQLGMTPLDSTAADCSRFSLTLPAWLQAPAWIDVKSA